MSGELMRTIFHEDADVQQKTAAEVRSAEAQDQQRTAVISVNDVLGSDDETRQRYSTVLLLI